MPTPTPPQLALVVFHVQSNGNGSPPIPNANVTATSPNGNWSSYTDAAGSVVNPVNGIAGVELAPGHYDIVFTRAGFASRTLPADIGDSGQITVGLDPTFSPAPRNYAGNMCGVRVPGLPAVPGGASDPSLVLSWFIARYQPADRAKIYAVWHAAGCVDVLVSWPDDRGFGLSAQQAASVYDELITNGFRPCLMLSSKDYDPADVPGILANIAPILPFVIGVIPRVCFFWEGNLWLSPEQAQLVVDTLYARFLAYRAQTFVHFSGGYFAYQPNGQDSGYYWQQNVGKLTGILHQRDPAEDQGSMPEYQARLSDCLVRFAGQFNCPPDGGFGVPFLFIALEITADAQFNGQMDEATGNQWGIAAISTPAAIGPLGPVIVMGSGNGRTP